MYVNNEYHSIQEQVTVKHKFVWWCPEIKADQSELVFFSVFSGCLFCYKKKKKS